MRNVSVTLNADNQIEVQVGTESRAGESYYLGLQPNSPSLDFQPATGAWQLVTEWIRLLTTMEDGQQLFLPFDFSDEYTRWLTLRRENRDVAVAFGWATIEGWAISPCDLSEYASGLPGFMPDEPMVLQTFYLPRFLSELRHCQAVLHDNSREEQQAKNGNDRLT
jgi:hypothetical protein